MPFTGNRQFKEDPELLPQHRDVLRSDDQGVLFSMACLVCGHVATVIMLVKLMTRSLSKPIVCQSTFQFGHPGAFKQAERITQFMPEALNRVFFCGSGSEANTALKIARGYWRARGQASKTRLIGRTKGYHGVNFGGISVEASAVIELALARDRERSEAHLAEGKLLHSRIA